MQSLANRLSDPNRYSAGKTVKPIPFVCLAPDAQAVFMAGDFNHWNERSHPMQRTTDGAWRLMVELKHGHHHYRFVVDGKQTLDPSAVAKVIAQLVAGDLVHTSGEVIYVHK